MLSVGYIVYGGHMVKEMEKTTGLNINDEETYERPADFGKNEIIVYRGSRIGRIIVAFLGGIVLLNIVLCIVSVGMFSKSIKMNNAAISQSRELIEAMSALKVPSVSETAKEPLVVSNTKMISEEDPVKDEVPDEVSDSTSSNKVEPVNSPVRLSAMKMVSQNNAKVSDQCQNTLGDTYTNAILGNDYKDTWATYYLDGKYRTLSADLSVFEQYNVSEAPYTFEIYKNNDTNSVIYMTTLSRLSTVEHLDVDVGEAEFITIRAHSDGIHQRATFILSNAELVN